MPLPVRSRGRIKFGEFLIDLQTGELSSNGHKSTLSEQPLQLLIALLEQPGELVTRDELRKRLWGSETYVEFDLGLNKAMNRLRESLKDSAEHPRYIELAASRIPLYRKSGGRRGSFSRANKCIEGPAC